jgi:hypothetical protein
MPIWACTAQGKLHHISAVPPPEEVFATLLTSLEKVDSLAVDATPASPAPENTTLAAPKENGEVHTDVAPSNATDKATSEGVPTPVGAVTYEEAESGSAPEHTKSIASHEIRLTEENSTVAAEVMDDMVPRRTGSVAAEGSSAAEGAPVGEEKSEVAQAAVA